MPLTLISRGILTIPATSTYTGPGDVVSGAVAWWGLRAYSSATIGTNAIRLRESGGNTEQDFATIAGGGLDLSAISTFKGANNVFVVKLYDQSGNGRDLAQATAGTQPQLQFSVLGSLPAIKFTAASSTELLTSNLGALSALPFTLSTVLKVVSTGGFQSYTTVDDSINAFPNSFVNGAGLGIYNGAAPTVSVTDNTFYTVQDLYSDVGANCIVCINGSDNTVSAGTGNSLKNVITMGSNSSGQPFNSFINELGYWAGAFSSGNRTSMDSNQRTYWGF